MVERVAELVALRVEIAPVLVVRLHLDRHLLDDLEAEALDPGRLLRVVRQDANRRQAEIGEDLVADPPVARIGGEAEGEVRLDGVEALLLELVGLQLVQQADPAPFLRHVEEHSSFLRSDSLQRELELLAAVAFERVEDVAGQALRMDADEHVLLAVDLAFDECDVVLAGQRLAEGHGRELAVDGRQPHGGDALDELLVTAPVLDQVGDRDHLELVGLAIRHEVRDAGHRAVVLHDLADDARGIQAGEPRQVDGSLGLAGALEHAAAAGAQREDVARLHEVRGLRGRVDRNLDRPGAVLCGDPGGDALARLDRDGEGGPERRLVLVGHLAQAELVATLLGQAQTDEAARVRDHEVDRVGGGELRRDREVALVLAVLVVDDDDEPALADLLDRLLDGGERTFGARRGGHRHGRIVPGSSFSTYLASTSVSRLTLSPVARSESVVSASVCGISATSNAVSSTAATVSDTPSTVTDPFSTQ